MPPSSKTKAGTATATADPAGKATTRSRSEAKPGTATPAATPELQTFAEHTGSRPFTPRAASDEARQIRSFSLDTGLVERLRATADGIQHKAYGTDLENSVPQSIAALAAEGIEAACTYYENILNNGEEFRRVRKLPAGPSRDGAQRGAAKRAAKRAAATESGEAE
jgi:hypothetical protein